MPPIEQVSKRLFSDPHWLKKCAVGGFLILAILPIPFVCGYLYRVFSRGKRGKPFSLPEWNLKDWKSLLVEGLVFMIFNVVFIAIPIGVIMAAATVLPKGEVVSRISLVPVVFLAGPLMAAALYLYQVRGNFKDSLNFSAIGIMLKEGAMAYAVPTLAFIGLLLLGGWVLSPFIYFFGGTIYFYQMSNVYRDLESQSFKS